MISKNSILKNLEKYLKRSFKGKVRINESSLIAYLLVGGFFCFVSNVGYATVAGKEEIKYQNNGSKTEDGLAINFAKALGNSQTIAIGGNDDDGGNGNAIAKGEGSIAIGGKSRTEGSNAVAVGVEAAANEGATALGAKSKSLGTNSIALGLEAEAKQNESIAIGHAAKADELHAISMGYKANAKSQNGISIGAETVADGQNSIVIGKGSKTSELTDEDGIGLAKKPRDASVVIGVDSVSKNQYTITMGHRAQTLGQDSFAFGNESKARKDRAIAFGERTIADGENSMALGSKAGAYTVNTLAFGAGAQAKESQAISIGNKAHSNGENSISIGTTSLVGKVGQYGMSTGEKIVKNGTAIGGYSNVDANGGTTIGSFTTVNNEGGVALGIDSIANVAGGKAGAKQTYSAYNSTKAGAFTSTDTYKGNMRAGVAPRNNLKAGAVSVGKADGSFTRQIVGLAAGTEDTDAVNVAQLKSLTMKIEGDQNEGDTPKVGLWDGSLKVTAKGTGSIKASTVVEGNKVTVNVDSTDLEKKIQAAGKVKYFSVKSTGGKNENNDGATADNAVAIGKDSSATEENSIALGSDATTANAKKEVTQAEVQAGNGDKVVYNGFAGTKPYAQLSVGSKDKERQIKNVAAGEVSASSTDAVNGSQLYAVAAKPMTYTDDKGTQINRLLGQNINLKGGAQGDLSTGNIAVEASGTDTLNIKLAKNLKEIDSISKNGKAGSPKITLGDSNISFNSDVDMGSKKITNVATPTSETDAANKKYVDDIRTTVQSSDNSITVTDNDKGDKYAYDIKVDRKNTKLSYKANGGDPKETSLETGLNFTGGNLITASAEENGTIKYDIKTGKVKSDENGKIIKDGDNGVLTTENLVENLNKIGWKANAMAGEGGKLDGSAKSTLVKMGDEVVFAAGKNLIVKQEAVEGKQTYTYSLSEKLEDLTSVTTKNTEGDTVVQDGKGITITPKNLEKGKTSVSLTKDGLNNGGNKITNVAEGTEDTDAVNKSQLDKAIKAGKTKVVKGTNIASVEETIDSTTKASTYTVNAEGAKVIGVGGVEVTESKDNTTNVTTYKVDTTKLNNDIKGNTEKISEINTDLQNGVFSVSANGADKDDIKINENVDFSNTDGNITIGYDAAKNKFTHNLSKNLKNIETIEGNGSKISFGNKTISVDNSKITNVAEGTEDTDAVNKSQLDKAIKAGKTKVVKGTNIASVEETIDSTTKASTYTVNAEGAKVIGVGGVEVTESKDNTTNVTTYKVDTTKLNNDIKGNTEKISEINTDLQNGVFSVSANGADKDDIKINENVDFSNTDGNITIGYDAAKNKFTHNLSKNLKNIETIEGNGSKISFGNKTISVDNSKITNVAEGTEDTDAVNKSQLDKAQAAATTKVEGSENIQVDKTPEKDGSMTYTVKTKDKMTLGKDSDKKIVADGETGKLTVGKEVEMDGTTGDARFGKVQVNGKEGTVGGLTNTTWDKDNIVSGQAATEDQLQVLDKKMQNNTEELINKGMDFSGNDYDAKNAKTKIHKKLGDRLEIIGGLEAGAEADSMNLRTRVTDDGKLELLMAKNPKFKSVEAGEGDTKVTIGNTGIQIGDKTYITKDGINANGNKITNVAEGTEDTDAVNKSQLDKAQAAATTKVEGSENIQVDKTPEKDGSMTYTVKTKDKMTLGKDSDKKIVADGETGKLTVGKEVEMDGTTGDARFGKVQVNGKEGTVGGLTNTTWDKDNIVSGQAATEDQLQVLDKKMQNNTEELINKGMDFSGNDYDAKNAKTKIHKKLGDRLEIIGGLEAGAEADSMNLRTRVTDDGKLELLMAKNPKFKSVEAGEGDTKVTIGNTGIQIGDKTYITKDGINANGNKITNVAEGTEDTDAVNKSQLDKAQAAATTKVEGSENIQVDKTPEKDGSMTYTVKTKDKMTLGKDSDKKIVADGETGKLTVGKEVEMDGTTGDARFGKVQVNGKEGTVGGLTNTTWDKDNIVSGQAATEDQLQVLDKKMQNNTEELINKGMDFSGNDYDAKNAKTKIHKKLGDRLEIIGGLEAGAEADSMNLRTRVTDDGKLELLMAKNPKFKSVEAGEGDTKVTIGNTGIQIGDKTYITKDGINANGNKITNVAEGTADTDAVNKSQLDKAQAAATTKVEGSENIQVDKTPEKDGSMTYTVKTKDKMTLGKDSDKKIVADGETGKLTVGKEVEMDGTTGNARFGTVKVNGEKGTVGGLTNKTWDKDNIVSGQAATEDQLQVLDKKMQNNTEELINKGMDFSGNDYDAKNAKTKIHKKLGDRLEIIGSLEAGVEADSKNLRTRVTDDGKLELLMAKNPKFKSVEAGEGDTKVTIGDTGIKIGDKTYITKDGINANGNKITNVAEGTADTDAVNKGQLDKAKAAATTKVKGSDNIQVDGTPEADGSMTYTVKTKDKMTLGKDSDKKIVADGETGKLTVGKEVEMDGTTGDARFGKVQVNGEKGTVGGLTNKTWDKNKIVSGQAATEDQLKAVDDKVDNLGNKIDETTNKVEKGLNFAADTGKATNRKLGDTLTIAGDNNNITTSVEEGKVKVALKEDVKVKTLTSETVTTDKLILKGKDGKTTDVGETLDKHDKDIQENKNAIKKGLNFAANHGEVNKQLGDTMSIKGKDGLSEKEIEEKYDVENIVTSVDKEGNLWIKMAKNPKFKSVEAGEGDTKVTIGDIGIKIGDKTYITKDGINANDNKIKNVADGKVAKGSKDAINGGQLHDALSNVQEGMNQINHRVDKLDDRMHRGLANAAAMSTVEFLEIGINQATVGAAIGTYRGNQAVAVGVQAAPTENMRVHAKVSVAPSRNNTETMAGVGASWRFNIK